MRLCLCLLFSLLLIGSCSDERIRTGLSVWSGIKPGPDCHWSEWESHLPNPTKDEIKGYWLRIPFIANPGSSGSPFQYHQPFVLDSLLPFFMRYQCPYGLKFALKNPGYHSPYHFNPDHYLTDISGILLRTKFHPPAQIIFSGEFLNPSFTKNKLKNWVADLRKAFPDFHGEIVFEASLSELESPHFDWKTPDMIAIRHDLPDGVQSSSFFSTQNRKISQLLVRYQKPAVVLHKQKEEDSSSDYINQKLRYWNRRVDLKGLVIASSTCQPNLWEDRNDYAVYSRNSFENFLHRYLQD